MISNRPMITASTASSDSAITQTLTALGIHVFERGWLSSNNVLLLGGDEAALIDTGYATHADMTVALMKQALNGRELAHIVNTHLHSDHCGGNAALQAAWPKARTLIPPGLASAVAAWDSVALSHAPTGQQCPRFTADGLLAPGSEVQLGGLKWDVLSAEGHDPHAVILFQRDNRILISADALWANGFGVVFPELEGESGFLEVGATLDLIESLDPAIVIPGHGPVFAGESIDCALSSARSRLERFIAEPARHRRHALKVLIKFKILEWQRCPYSALSAWFLGSSYFLQIAERDQSSSPEAHLCELLDELERGGALAREGDDIVDR